jgi:hypothetical protein
MCYTKLMIMTDVNTLGNVAQGHTELDRSVQDEAQWPCERSESCGMRTVHSLSDVYSLYQGHCIHAVTSSAIQTLE